ncbi:MAG: nitrilase-related carbon-nitrogen hydrolase [Halobacteriaceae archaeon]
MKLALAQLDIQAGECGANVDRGVDAVHTAADRGADLVALPELFNVGFFAFDDYAAAAEPIGGSTHARLATAAADNDVAVLAGSIVEDLAATHERGLPVPAETGLANTAVLFDRNGDRQLTYRKHHLWGYDSREADLLVPGDGLELASFGGFTVAATTCYDLRFPELYRTLSAAGASLIVVPSAWPYPRVEHWRVLPRARAIENLAYIATINGAGTMGDTTLCGRSSVYDPWGTSVTSTGEDPTLAVADIDAGHVADIRDDFPALDDRRTRDFYVRSP